MNWKIIFIYYGAAAFVFAIYFISVLQFGKFFNEKGGLNTPYVVITYLLLILIFTVATFQSSRDLESELENRTEKDIEQFTPNLDIKIFSNPDEVPSPYRYPLKLYTLLINNTNKESSKINDIFIEFVFDNSINTVISEPFLAQSGKTAVANVKRYIPSLDSTNYLSKENALNIDDFKLEIQTANFKSEKINTNIAIFRSKEWPKNAVFSAEIIVDFSKKPPLYKSLDKVYTYSGEFSLDR